MYGGTWRGRVRRYVTFILREGEIQLFLFQIYIFRDIFDKDHFVRFGSCSNWRICNYTNNVGTNTFRGVDVEEEGSEVDTRGTTPDWASRAVTGACKLSCLRGTVEGAFLLFLAI
jgi:hypothetical protein